MSDSESEQPMNRTRYYHFRPVMRIAAFIAIGTVPAAIVLVSIHAYLFRTWFPPGYDETKWRQIAPGMTSAEVLDIMGKPYRQGFGFSYATHMYELKDSAGVPTELAIHVHSMDKRIAANVTIIVDGATHTFHAGDHVESITQLLGEPLRRGSNTRFVSWSYSRDVKVMDRFPYRFLTIDQEQDVVVQRFEGMQTF